MPRDNQPTPAATAGTDSQVKFSVCALTDLLGFSSHLEISGYDLRTAIGEHAIHRLQGLEEAMDLIQQEQNQAPEAYPNGLRVQRINDAIIATMDLDDILVPSVGETSFRGLSSSDMESFFDMRSFDNADDFEKVYVTRLRDAVKPLHQFLGIVARLHLFIQQKEGGNYYPGARTVIASGFRRPFPSKCEDNDVLSANFAFANATVADKALHGPHFYLDNNLIELSSREALARNLLRFSHYEWTARPFDCLTDESPEHGIARPCATDVSGTIELMLFRRRYYFRRLNPSPLSYLQHLIYLRPCLDGEREADRTNPFIAHVLDAIQHGMSDRMIREASPPRSFLFNGTNDLQTSLIEFNELLTTGDSPSRKARQRREYLKKEGHPELEQNSKFMAELDKLESETVTIELEPLRPSNMGDFIWRLSEAQLTALLPLLGDDFSALEFPRGVD